ncbi:VanRG2 [Candidatus Scalindua japonica]|uniref:VanRG2 n=2 Tax=Candidatus Scalindua japonica TaxID=1284222 RepID=A0A286U3C9_9BACT|nr:VanRG2 [Candidatus Scalindua japonica]
MCQKMLFNHNSDKGYDSGLLMDILSVQSDDYIIRIKNNIKRFSQYKNPGTKNTLTNVQYVYRTLTNVEVFKSISADLTKAEKHFLSFLCGKTKKEVSWEEIKSAGFTEKLVKGLCLFGLVFIIWDLEKPKKVILPYEYRYLLFSNNRDKESVLYVLRTMGVEKVKQITDYLNENFNGKFDVSLSKASNMAFLYNFLISRGEEIKSTLTAKQKEIILFVLQRGNEVELEVLLDQFTNYNVHAWDTSINTIFNNHFYHFQARQQGDKYTELQKLFHMGALVFKNHQYSNNVLIPKEIFPLLAREYLAKAEAAKQKIMAEMISDIPNSMNGKSTDSLLQMLTRNIVIFLVFSHVKPTQKSLIPKAAIKKCARILGINHIEQIDCISIFLLLKEYITNRGRKCFVLTQKGKNLLFGKLSVMDFRKEIENFFLISTDWNELYKSPNRVLDYYAIPLNCDFKGLLYRCMKDMPHQWLKTDKFRELLYADYNFTKIDNIHDSLDHIQEEHYLIQSKSDYNDLDGMYVSIIKTMYFLGFVDIVQGEKSITHFKLSKTAIALATDQVMDVKQTKVHTEKKIILQPNGEILCMPGTQLDILSELGKFTEFKKIDHTIIFELSSKSLIKGVTNFELDLAKIKTFLTDHTGKELPQNIAYLFKQLKEKEDLLTVGTCGGYIMVKDRILLEDIKNIKSVQKHIADSNELPVLVLKSDAGIKEVLRELRKKGHLPKVKEMEPESVQRFDSYEEDDYF